ncbi:hypothetical protein [Halorientalis litorea]|uniref:hypothetical protein n=1 Tax=Halorientalis litorea TaxID=2931977 RepID=UPI001FF3FD62|nr:hypothetical protein [Halorientalis litorea]
MELSSCYFCGTALDAPVSAHPLGADGGDPTVSLCPTCRRKLAAVLDAVADPGATADALDTEGRDDAAETPAADTLDDTDADEEAGDGAETVGADVSVSEKATLESDTNLLHDIGDDSDEDGDETAEPSAQPESEDETGTADTEPTAETASSVGDDWQNVVGGESADADSEPASGTESDEQEDDDHGTASDHAEETSPEQTAPDDDSTTTERGDDGGDTPSILSTPTAKKVIRLLQNREFPVDREEFEVVAASAYDLSPRDCADAIDALVAEGYVAEDGDHLVEPES